MHLFGEKGLAVTQDIAGKWHDVRVKKKILLYGEDFPKS